VRHLSALPPFAALAVVSGVLAPDYAQALAQQAATVTATATATGTEAGAVTVSPLDEGRFVLRAATHRPLCDLLARVPRPAGRGLRVEVDPPTL
jgi:hypothetical protein